MAHRIIIYGNSGAGKTTLARELHRQYSLPILDLDSIAWEPEWGHRRPLEASIAAVKGPCAENVKLV
jgi:adenylate kinase family enzyme